MRIRVTLHASLRERAGADTLDLDGLPEDLDVGGAKLELERRCPSLGSLGHVRGVLDERYVPDGQQLTEGAELHLLPPVSGGAPDSDEELGRGLFELSAAPIDPGALQVRVSHPSCGATVVFTGSTRTRNRGQDVERLDYEAFEAMAGPEMARIFDECRARFGPGGSEPGVAPAPEGRGLRMLCVHRTGSVGLGEPSVVVAVASPHRDAAFGACRFLIDTLKERLPVWKKEHYADGAHWIGDRS